MPIRVLVVDDSSLMRRLIARFLEEDGDIRVIDTAADGEEAIRKIQVLRPDVVTLDVEMPVLDGLATLSRIMRLFPLPVVMLSAHTTKGAKATMQALALGAVDFVAKPARSGETEAMVADLKFKVRAAAQASLRRRPAILPRPAANPPKTSEPPGETGPARNVSSPGRSRIEVVVIGSSTGGPAALQQIIPALPGTLPAGLVVVQHIPVGFSGPMAEHLDKKSKLKVKHAVQGDRVAPGLVLVAPAGYDLTFRRNGGSYTVNLDPGQGPVPPGGFRPSVDGVMKSAAETFHGRSMGVLLTGMGRDGAQGMLAIRRENGPTVAEAEITCVVFGMPRAAIEAGGAEKVLPLHEIAGEIIRTV
ncbi:MAG: chemotaxis response regulator protein-glutamate methylesterase [Peptococcaceae bacterium]|nr:chemotaxis response regulator protein-glutamate methylesterase [Peptococcaceae bacterium]